MLNVVSVRENPERLWEFIRSFQKWWASPNGMMVYEDCISHSVDAPAQLPQWYILYNGDEVIGGAGLITNDFISRGDLWPWLCSLYIEEEHRGKGYSALLIERCKADARKMGYKKLYLCTDHVGLYEKFGFERIGRGYHPWGESSDVFEAKL